MYVPTTAALFLSTLFLAGGLPQLESQPSPQDPQDPKRPQDKTDKNEQKDPDGWAVGLPPKIREAVANGNLNDVPPEYRELLERYYRKLADPDNKDRFRSGSEKSKDR